MTKKDGSKSALAIDLIDTVEKLNKTKDWVASVTFTSLDCGSVTMRHRIAKEKVIMFTDHESLWYAKGWIDSHVHAINVAVRTLNI